MHYHITYHDTHARASVFITAADAATAVTNARRSVMDTGSAFELLSVVPRPDHTPTVPLTLAPRPRPAL